MNGNGIEALCSPVEKGFAPDRKDRQVLRDKHPFNPLNGIFDNLG
jgi:hypothetical protein